ncbi:MAG TPA: imidazole glycerol phosphate synthase subunit HisH [Candidatus Limnocylindria bacterium]|nr:imidazole glycerol phosphate synthase subunit HisH [Candidatus Limnocylindria bacterium]
MTRIAVVDYGSGNLVSIEHALTTVGADVKRVDRPSELAWADAIVVPGVGAAGPAMERLHDGGLVEPIREWIAADRPALGICLGLQLLFESSDEDGAETLGVLAGRTRRLANAPTLPHIGWNQVVRTREHPLFAGIEPDSDFYFVHSFAGELVPHLAGVTLATTEHGGRFTCAVATGALAGVQFHPERSGDDGLRLLGNFVALVAAGTATAALPA